MRHENGRLELETGGYSFHLYGADRREIMRNDHMDMDSVLRNIELAAWNKYGISISDITCENGIPMRCHRMFFDYLDDREMVEHAICKLAEFSLTHRMMYFTDDGRIFVTESNDHQTNIDAELLDTISRNYLGKKPRENDYVLFTM